MSNKLFLKKIPQYYKVAAAGWINRAFVLLSQLIAIPILLKYLGVDLYAIFAVIIGLQGWFTLADCGIGSSLQNYISESRATNKEINLLLVNFVFISAVLLVVLCLGFILLSPFLQYFLLHKINLNLAVSNHYFFAFIGIIFIVTTICEVSYKVLFAKQQGHVTYFYQGLSSVISVICIISVHNIDKNRLYIALSCWLIPKLIVSVFSYIKVFPFKNILGNVDFSIIKAILIRGSKFWGFAIVAACTLSVDYIIMAQTLTAKDIAIYNILAKSFAALLSVYSTVLMAIWPELTEKFVKNQWQQANLLLNKNILFGFIFITISSFLFLLFRNLISTIIAPTANLILPIMLIILFGMYGIIRVWTDSYAMALQSQSHLKIFWIYVPIQALVSIVGMYFLSLWLGIYGILFGLILSFILTVVWALPREYFKKLNKMKALHAI